MTMARRHLLTAAAACAALVATGPGPACAQAPDIKSFRVGYALPKTGAMVAGASQSLNAYRMWIREVNDSGGIMLKSIGRKVPIEVVEYDSRSSEQETVKLVERLATQDKVDFILAPWGTNFNVAAAATFQRLGYPLLAPAITDDAAEYVKKWPDTFWLQDTTRNWAQSLVDLLVKMHGEGKVGDTVAAINVADQLGVELARDAKPALLNAGFKIVYEKSYSDGADMAPIMKDVAAANPEIFLGFSYPPDTMALTTQAIALKFNPKVFYAAAGPVVNVYPQRFRGNVEGVMGIGGGTPDTPAAQEWRKRFVAIVGSEPHRTSSIPYDILQMLQQAIERVGRIDRVAIANEIRTGSFETLDGPAKLTNNILSPPFAWYVGQWQNGEYYGVAPLARSGVHAPILKPEWQLSTGSVP